MTSAPTLRCETFSTPRAAEYLEPRALQAQTVGLLEERLTDQGGQP
jgi:hypothetical protein